MCVSSTPRRRRRTFCTSGNQATISTAHIKVILYRAISRAQSTGARSGCAATIADRPAIRWCSLLAEKHLATKYPAISTWGSTSARSGRRGGGKRKTKSEERRAKNEKEKRKGKNEERKTKYVVPTFRSADRRPRM